MSDATGQAVSPPAQLDLFGFHPTAARVRVIPRSTGWRIGHACLALLLGWGAIPIVMWVPPHFPWVLSAFGVGLYYSIRYARERYTLVEMEGTCPRCGAPQVLSKPTRLAIPHRVACPQCHQQLLLRIRLDAPEAAGEGEQRAG